MYNRKLSIVIEICLCLVLFTSSFADKQKCEKTKCKGPLAYYEALKCKGIKKHPEDCCAFKYDCSHLDKRSTTKCYVNNRVYEIGEKLRDEDANPCDIGCTCVKGYLDGIASFSCAIVDCFQPRAKEGCYRKNSPSQCCPGEEVCPENPEDRAICLVHSKSYKDGEYFTLKKEPDKSCICQPDYKEKNVEPFCSVPKRPYCAPDFRHSNEIHKKCAPVYYSNQSPQTSCSVFSRCQNSNDTLISHSKGSTNSKGDKSNICTFGNFKMQIGDELNQATDYNSVCVKCVCEVPPIPTCQRLPDNECDVTVHPPFHQF